VAAAAVAANTTTAVDVASPAAAKGAGSGKTFEERRGGNVCGEGTFVERARTHLACVTDASIGKGISISDHWCKGVRYARYASGGSGAY